MTNKEAIKILKNYHNGYFGYKIDDVHEAHNLAIKALEERPQGDLISREALINDLKHFFTDGVLDGVSARLAFNQILHDIDNAPTVEYTFEEAFQKSVCEQKLYCPSRPQGEWYYNYQNGWHCSICHETVKDMPTVMGKANFTFCPNCGADMRKGGEEE